MKKLFFAVLLLSVSKMSLAAPIVNENPAIGSIVTIYGDSQDPNLYYWTPQYMGLCDDDNGDPVFSYTEFRPSGIFSMKRGMMMSTMCLKNHPAEIQEAEQEILKKNPHATFAGLPYTASSISFSDAVFQKEVEKNACSHLAGVVGQEEACSLVFTPRGKDMFLKALRGGLAITMQLSYQIDGVKRTPAGFVAASVAFSLAARISKSDFNGKLENYLPKQETYNQPNEQ